eukprot:12420989-Karenia_brevis.AAC.1
MNLWARPCKMRKTKLAAPGLHFRIPNAHEDIEHAPQQYRMADPHLVGPKARLKGTYRHALGQAYDWHSISFTHHNSFGPQIHSLLKVG